MESSFPLTNRERKILMKGIENSIFEGMCQRLFLDPKTQNCYIEGRKPFEEGYLANKNINEGKIIKRGRATNLEIRQVSIFPSTEDHNPYFLMNDHSIYRGYYHHFVEKSSSKEKTILEISEYSRVLIDKSNHDAYIKERSEDDRKLGDIFNKEIKGNGNFLKFLSNRLISSKQKRKKEPKIKKVIKGGNHVFFISKKGELYGTGSNKFEQLFITSSWKEKKKENDCFYEYPIQISMKKEVKDYDGSKIKEIKCGNNHSLLLSDQNFLYGSGRCGSFGYSFHSYNKRKSDEGVADKKDTERFRKLEFYDVNTKRYQPKEVEYFACGREHDLIICKDSCIYAFGDNWNKKTGINKSLLSKTELNDENLNHKPQEIVMFRTQGIKIV